MHFNVISGLAAAVLLVVAGQALAQVPQSIAAPGETAVVTLQAQGAQIYECRAGGDGRLAWAGREPAAALLQNGKTVGRHYAGPTWEHIDGSAVVAKAAGSAPGASPQDVAWLKLSVVSSRGTGLLSGITTVQRINTAGGALSGSCDKAAGLQSVAYSTDYVFLKK
jgi:hypothetical protein